MANLRCGLGVRHVATNINQLGVSTDKNRVVKSTVTRLTKNIFGVVQDKCKIIHFGPHDKKYAWANTIVAIMIHFREYLRTKKSSLMGMLFLDNKSEFCLIAQCVHNRQVMANKWHAPINKVGE